MTPAHIAFVLYISYFLHPLHIEVHQPALYKLTNELFPRRQKHLIYLHQKVFLLLMFWVDDPSEIYVL